MNKWSLLRNVCIRCHVTYSCNTCQHSCTMSSYRNSIDVHYIALPSRPSIWLKEFCMVNFWIFMYEDFGVSRTGLNCHIWHTLLPALRNISYMNMTKWLCANPLYFKDLCVPCYASYDWRWNHDFGKALLVGLAVFENISAWFWSFNLFSIALIPILFLMCWIWYTWGILVKGAECIRFITPLL